MVTITELATTKVREIIQERDAEGKLFLRIYVTGGGCSGLSYGMSLDERRDDDHVIDSDGVTVLVDPMSAQYLRGCEVDYKEALMGGGFAITNPNAVRTCGCGQSFRTDDNAGEAEQC